MASGLLTLVAPQAEAVVVRPFTIGYDADVFGDFIEVGNGNMRCPTATEAPTAPVSLLVCAAGQARTDLTNSAVNDNFALRYADVDSDAATFNSSRAALTIPAGARVTFAGSTGRATPAASATAAAW
ncbi:MAG: hypothetical protein NTW05_21875 [Pseudonocardiales bacterium]|nr:hypothetical protein [Pseudonocardiales bacterium]